MQTPDKPRATRRRETLSLPFSSHKTNIPFALRAFRIDLVCDASPYTWHGDAPTSTEAIQRARHAFAQQPCVREAGIRMVACVELGPATLGRAMDSRRGQR